MKNLIRLIVLMFPITGFAQDIDSVWTVTNYTKLEKTIPMRDGVKLFTTIYTPKNATEKHPILITRTPYSAAPYGENKFAKLWINRMQYLRENYTLVIQDVRGRWMSEGEFVDIRPFDSTKQNNGNTDEASDTYDTIDWLLKNVANNNGNVGVFGVSYPGFYSTMAALSNHPALKAVSPQAPVTDWFMGDDFHHNGAFMMMDAFAFYSSFGRPRPMPTTVGPEGFNFPTRDNYKFYLQTGALSNFTSKYMGDSIKFWQDLMNHGTLDDWWKARTVTNFISNVKPATLVVGGLFDAEDVYGAWHTYEAIEKRSPGTNNRLVMGPWYHGQWSRGSGANLGNIQFGSATSEWYQKNVELPFFNFYLKGKGTAANIAEATIFFTGANEWKRLPQWPPANVEQREMFLNKGAALTWTKPEGPQGNRKPTDEESFSEYISDPSKPVPYTEDVHTGRTREYMTDDQRFASRRPDVLTFETEVLTEDLTLAGSIIADLSVSTTGTDADFVVKVIDVFPDNFKYSDSDKYIMGGYQMLVRGEVMRGKFRNSFEKPEPFVAKKITKVNFTLPDVAHTFKKGHKLMVQVQSSWFPLVDRNPQKFVDIYKAKDEDFQKATIKVYHNEGVSSRLILPVLK